MEEKNVNSFSFSFLFLFSFSWFNAYIKGCLSCRSCRSSLHGYTKCETTTWEKDLALEPALDEWQIDLAFAWKLGQVPQRRRIYARRIYAIILENRFQRKETIQETLLCGFYEMLACSDFILTIFTVIYVVCLEMLLRWLFWYAWKLKFKSLNS